jgi:hypothetical protein
MNKEESQRNPLLGPAAPELPGALPLAHGRREVFARLRSRGFSPLPAAREAGYPDITPKNAQKMAQDQRIRARVAYLTRQEEEVLAEQRQILLERQWHWHDSDIADFFERAEEPVTRDGKLVLKQDGTPLMRQVKRLKPLESLTREQRLCIESITWTERGKPNLRLYSRAEANKELRKLLGLDKPLKVAATNTEGKELPSTADRARALAAFIAETQAEMAQMDAGLVEKPPRIIDALAVNAAGNAEMSDGARAQHLMRPVGTAPESPKALALRVLTAVAQQFEALVADSDAAAGAVRGLRRLADAFDHANAADRAGAVAAFIARAKYEIGGPAQRVLRDAADALEAVMDDDATAAFVAKNTRQLADGIEARSHEIPELLAGGQAARASR